MNKFTIITTILCMCLLCGCNSNTGKQVKMSKEDYEKLVSMAAEADKPTATPEPTKEEQPTETPTPEPTEIPEEVKPSGTVDLDSGEWTLIEFKDPDVKLAIPSYMKDWPNQYPSEDNHSYDCESSDYVHLRVDAYITGEPIPEYSDEYVKPISPDLGTVYDWSFENNLFRKYSHNNPKDLDILTAIYYPGDCEISCVLSLPPEKMDEYKDTFEAMVQYMTEEAYISTDSHMDENEIVEKVRKMVGSPKAEIDHYDDNGTFTIHCYEEVDNGDEAHIATWAWIVVDPTNRTAYDDITMEPFDGIFE